MTVSLRSSREAHLVGDVFEEAGKAVRFLGARDAAALLRDEVVLYAVERAIANATEASIQIERGAYPGRFEALFPHQRFDDIRILGNVLRHDYSGQRIARVMNTVTTIMVPLRDWAEELLKSHRRLHGD